MLKGSDGEKQVLGRTHCGEGSLRDMWVPEPTENEALNVSVYLPGRRDTIIMKVSQGPVFLIPDVLSVC